MTQAQIDFATRSYSYPLSVPDRKAMFEQWCDLNPDALREMESAALAINARGQRVSAQYLVERQRYEGTAPLHPVPFTDWYGETHTYAINNSDCALLGRWLVERHPYMKVNLRRSMFDGDAA